MSICAIDIDSITARHRKCHHAVHDLVGQHKYVAAVASQQGLRLVDPKEAIARDWAALKTTLPIAENISEFAQRQRRSQPIQNLVSPETLKPVQRLVKRNQLIETEAADLLDRAHMLLVERINDVAYFATFAGQLDAHRAPIEAGALVVEKANLGELLRL